MTNSKLNSLAGGTTRGWRQQNTNQILYTAPVDSDLKMHLRTETKIQFSVR